MGTNEIRHEPPKTHRLEFNIKMVLHSLPSQYRIQSVRDDKTKEWKIVAGLAINTTEGVLSFQMTPWMHSDIAMVSIFYRRQDPVENLRVKRLLRILKEYQILFEDREMKRG